MERAPYTLASSESLISEVFRARQDLAKYILPEIHARIPAPHPDHGALVSGAPAVHEWAVSPHNQWPDRLRVPNPV